MLFQRMHFFYDTGDNGIKWVYNEPYIVYETLEVH